MKLYSRIAVLISILVVFSLFAGCNIVDPDDNDKDKTTPMTDAEAVADAGTKLDYADITFAAGDSSSTVTDDFVLPLTGANGTVIAWSEKTDAGDNIDLTNDSATITRPSFDDGDATVVLTATISKGTEESTKDFSLTIKALDLEIHLYVSTTGDDTTGTGAIDAPYASIRKAVLSNYTNPAKRVIAVAGGTYEVDAQVNIFNSDCDGIKVYGGYNSTFTARDIDTNETILNCDLDFNGALISINDSDNVVFDGFTITIDYSVEEFYYIYLRGKNNKFSNNKIIVTGTATSGPRTGIFVTGYGYTIKNNTFDFSGCIGDDVSGVDFNGALQANGEVSASQSITTIENNHILMPGWYAGTTNTRVSKGCSISFSNQSNHTIIVKNNVIEMSNPDNSKIELIGMNIVNCQSTDNSSKVYVIGNKIIAQESLTCKVVNGVYTNTVKNVLIANNLINITAAGVAYTYMAGMNLQNDQINMEIYNNTIKYIVNGSGVSNLAGILAFSSNTGTYNIKNNIIYLSSDTGTTKFFGIGNSSWGGNIQNTDVLNCLIYTNKAETSGLTYDVSCITGSDPLLDVNLKLQSSSPSGARTSGLNLFSVDEVMETDFEGASRPSTGNWSMGAFVYP